MSRYIRAANIRRYLVIGNAGSLYEGGRQLVDSDEFPRTMQQGAKSARDYAERLRRETFLAWTYLAPPVEIDTTLERTGKFRYGGEEPIVKNNVSSISIEDLAMAVVDEVEKKSYSRQRFTIGY